MAYGKKRSFRARSATGRRKVGRKYKRGVSRRRSRSAGSHAMIRGCGDYRTSRASVVTNAREIPRFANTKMSNMISHREYIGDVYTSPVNAISDGSANVSTQFQIGNVIVNGKAGVTTPLVLGNQGFAINPGLKSSFPWLASLADSYECYKIHGMVYEFKSTSADALSSANTALGTVIMGTEYNAAATVFNSKQQMENYEFSQSCKPSESMMHAIECAPNLSPNDLLYVRDGPVPFGQDPRLFDFGLFQIATVGMQQQNVNIGELWVTYLIEMLKPKIVSTGDAAFPGTATSFFDYGTVGDGGGTAIGTIVPTLPPYFNVPLFGAINTQFSAKSQSVLYPGFTESTSANVVTGIKDIRNNCGIFSVGWTVNALNANVPTTYFEFLTGYTFRVTVTCQSTSPTGSTAPVMQLAYGPSGFGVQPFTVVDTINNIVGTVNRYTVALDGIISVPISSSGGVNAIWRCGLIVTGGQWTFGELDVCVIQIL